MPSRDLGSITPSDTFVAVTPSDSTLIGTALGDTKGLYIGGGGNVTCIDCTGAAVTFTAVPVGTVLPVRTRRVNSTNTTATNIVALF
jgi:hypothetical protein